MRLHGSLLIISLVLIVGAAGNVYECYGDEESSLDSLHNFTWSSISCIIKSSQLNCSWSAHLLPADAQYSASFYLSSEDDENEHHLICSSNNERERVECLGQIYSSYTVTVHVNISVSSQRHVICKEFQEVAIEILDPPKIISAEIKSKALEIKWSRPKTLYNTEDHCFEYELNISGEIVKVEPHSENLTYTKQNVDLTRTYSIQMRANVNDDCGGRPDKNWSEWSESKVVEPREPPYQLNVCVIISIAFVLPMILLAILLLCKFQRFSEKLFPSIPSPSAKVKSLLERDDFSQVIPPKQCGSEAEEGTEIFQVTS